MKSLPSKIPSLTPLRGIAAAGVVSHHVNWFLIPVLGTGIHEYTNFVVRSYLFVDFFFLLSGFLLSCLYCYQLQFKKGLIKNYTHFIRARVARIYPLHLVTLFVVLLLIQFGESALYAGYPSRNGNSDIPKFETFAENFFLVQPLFRAETTWNQPSWSISAEMFAYASFPMLLLAGRFKSSALKFLFAAGLICVLGWLSHRYGSLNIGGKPGIARCITEVTLGILAATVVPVFLRASSRCNLIVFLSGVIGAIIVMHSSLPDVISVLFFLLVILGSISMRGPVFRLLNSRPLILLGELSYSLYMWHWVLLIFIFTISPGIHTLIDEVKSGILVLIFFFVVSLCIAFCSNRWIERPTRRFINMLNV